MVINVNQTKGNSEGNIERISFAESIIAKGLSGSTSIGKHVTLIVIAKTL